MIVPLGPDQDVCVYNSLGTINFILDINGWFGNGSESTQGASFYAVSPPGSATPAMTPWPVLHRVLRRDPHPGCTLTVPVAGVDGVPAAVAPPRRWR